jgi:hypothetical protein
VGLPVQNSVKTAQEPTNPAQVIERRTTTRVIPADSLTDSQKPPDFWAYVANLEQNPLLWDRHLLYLYRIVSDSGSGQGLEKISRYFTLPDNTQVPVGNREEFEFALQSKYGGGTYRMILKKGAEWVAQERIRIEGPPKAIPQETSAPTIGPAGEYTGADVAKQAMHMVASHEAEAVNVGVRAMQGAAEVISRLAHQQTTPPSATDDLLKQAMVAMLQKALNPPPAPDPIETFAKFMALMQGAGGGATGGAVNPMVQQIMQTAVERMLNPIANGPAAPTASAELVRQLPQIASYAAEAIREWRLGSEAQRDTALVMTGKSPVPALPPGSPGAAAAPAPAPQVQPPPAAPGGTMVAPSLEWIETKITEILLANDMNPDEAADETISFLARMDPRLLQQLVQHGEAGVLQLFQIRPNLRPALQNVPRLQEFIKAFFKYAAEYQAQAQTEATAAAADPGSVNGGAPPKPN